METVPIQNAIRLISFHVINLEFSLDPTCPLGSMPQNFGAINVDLGFGLGFNDEKPNMYSVSFEVKIKDSKNYLNLVIKCLAVFSTIEPITQEFKDSGFVKINSPAIAFPFLRSFVNTFTTNAGITPVILPAFNFSKG
jgi:preprotein translocase subunit SecB